MNKKQITIYIKHELWISLVCFFCLFFNQGFSQNQGEYLNDTISKTQTELKKWATVDRVYGKNNSLGPFFDIDVLNVSDFVRRIYEDSRGNLWLGTNGDGVIRLKNDTLHYYADKKGFPGAAVRAIVEDDKQNVWFATNAGLIKYDGKRFKTYTGMDGLPHDNLWSLFIDHRKRLWIGTMSGLCFYEDGEFKTFELPVHEPDELRGVPTERLVHSIMEDSEQRLWFGTTGGAYFLDGDSIKNLSEADGLCNNSVNDILEDNKGNIWFATHHNGICRYDGKSFTHFSREDGVEGTEVWDLYKDNEGNIWFPVEGFGIYRYDGNRFTNFNEDDGLVSKALQCTYQDRSGRIWCGGWKGLFWFDSKMFHEVSTELE